MNHLKKKIDEVENIRILNVYDWKRVMSGLFFRWVNEDGIWEFECLFLEPELPLFMPCYANSICQKQEDAIIECEIRDSIIWVT